MEDPILPSLVKVNYLNGLPSGHTNSCTNGTTPHPINHSPPEQPLWRKIAVAKQLRREQILAQHQDWRLNEPVPSSVKDVSSMPLILLTEREKEIVDQDATSLVSALRDRRYSALEVTTAFCKVNISINPLLILPR